MTILGASPPAASTSTANPSIATSSSAKPGADAAQAMKRMHRYTTGTTVAVAVVFVLYSLGLTQTPVLIVAVLLSAGFVVALMFFWSHPSPLWLSVAAVVSSLGVWSGSVALQDSPTTSVLFSLAAAVILTQRGWPPLAWIAAGLVVVLAPVGVMWLVDSSALWEAYTVVASISYACSMVVFLLNRYGWNRYLELDAARRTGEELAVAQERYRFAADLHDIQGHTLHVLRLKTQLADKLIDRDPAAAHQHLAEAQDLIAETLANTRSLAFGERTITVAGELANARQLFAAAGIACTVEDQSPSESTAAQVNEELLGLVVREATTNILRHAQPTAVSVRLNPGRVTIRNDGATDTRRPLSGLARLAERFEAIGGSLTTTTAAGIFTTEAHTR
ncbi:MAG TPA: histidine kinase [Glaciihabitans sp.]|nr:histidine kinase [Glaciihabitans sp.]